MKLKLLAAALVIGAAALVACSGDTIVNVDTNQNVGSPPASPTPAPSPSGSPSSARVSSIGIFAYGSEGSCPAEGQRMNGSLQYIVPAGCSYVITCTPFGENGQAIVTDAPPFPIAWSISGPGELSPYGSNAYNRTYRRLGAGVATVTCTLTGASPVSSGQRGFANS